ncbi:glutamine-dependent NAD(+) synthetase [Sodiomyces alkalinus F11]|uniref:Glutamine-dependent NAD(+) synthetase n=1 Tax=Sodiomyces alkalinus (strain CBS 110278 / VKM F-3762 / F11) TaxID=1314773 RepID=A0A3N2QAP2_SODAK|nr:glutamine-dependent NAD(+) synthetase [Sodiomyces alkalinus F11]ROT43738.1 glutamine-dependent NAD(+) synthetase [Sodiomyces alkalinus F11]
MAPLITLATCALNQWSLDFEGNLRRIKQSILQAKEAGATLRVGPELEIPGYGCLDHFLENEVYEHSLDSLYSILTDPSLHGIIIDVGLPLLHRNCRYNARAIILDGKILCLRPKLYLANDGNFREMRFFAPWNRPRHVEQYHLPPLFQKHQGRRHVPIGDVVLSTLDTCLAAETCEELFTPNSPHIDMGLNGVEIFTNSSGSHHSLRKLDQRIALIQEATRKNGGIYLYSNQLGCDGDRLYYDGCAMIFVNGNLVGQSSQFSLNEVELVVATVDLEEVRTHRFAPSRNLQAVAAPEYQRIEVDFSLSRDDPDVIELEFPTAPRPPRYHLPEEEIALGPACWLWDYLRRSKAAGYFVPLSGGIDSCATATIVYSMCRLVVAAIKEGNEQVIADVRRIAAFSPDHLPETAEALCNQIFCTCYMGMENQSSKETRQRAKDLSERIGSYHTDVNIDDTFHATKNILTQATGFEPKFKVHGGSSTSNLALQNIQARSRMVIAYYFAQELCEVRGRPGGGSLLVLGSSNVDECLRGYLTKYDCSSADINPIGSISKVDLKRFIAWAAKNFDMPILEDFIHATPTAELEPITADYVQSDEVDMGMSYQQLSRFGYLRKVNRLGPYGMFLRLLEEWGGEGGLGPREIADKVKRFHHYYQINRHKQTVATPSYHAEDYSPDDHRFDLRPFVYPPAFASWSFEKIDRRVAALEKKAKADTENKS